MSRNEIIARETLRHLPELIPWGIYHEVGGHAFVQYIVANDKEASAIVEKMANFKTLECAAEQLPDGRLRVQVFAK